MKVFFKRVFYSLIVSLTIVTLISNLLYKQLEEISSLNHENNYLADAGIICMQLYIVNPTSINKNTCIMIQHAIHKNNQELNNFALASIYLNYINKN
ncbi:MAG: hypothetical protein ACNI3C_10775 [Candidatus Marinarcus sp.]|uniref:hypothetical protein n=1 Tax=Candidatus Marinarcus sp. TaxID=3100987 RepID=UPI003AFF8CEF